MDGKTPSTMSAANHATISAENYSREAGGVLKWISEAEVARVDFNKLLSTASKQSRESSEIWRIENREAAVKHLRTRVSMVVMPRTAFEGPKYFYFSGGTTTTAVDDFSTGIAVAKETGEILDW